VSRKHVRQIGAAIVLISYLLPWFEEWFVNVSGWDLIEIGITFGSDFGVDEAVYVGIFALVTALFALWQVIKPNVVSSVLLGIAGTIWILLIFLVEELSEIKLAGTYVFSLGVIVSVYVPLFVPKDGAPVKQNKEQHQHQQQQSYSQTPSYPNQDQNYQNQNYNYQNQPDQTQQQYVPNQNQYQDQYQDQNLQQQWPNQNIHAEPMHCHNCGEAYLPDSKFCTSCGAPKKVPAEETVAATEEFTPEQPVNKQCPNCGTVLNPEAKFCGDCGRRFST
jgi:hypothetical protein